MIFEDGINSSIFKSYPHAYKSEPVPDYLFCFLEMGHGVAGFASGNFYADPKPVVSLKKPGRIWHWGKIAVEKWWMWKWF